MGGSEGGREKECPYHARTHAHTVCVHVCVRDKAI